MEGAEYRISLGDRIHRAAIVIAAFLITALFIQSVGLGRGIRSSAIILWPAVAIWFADDLAGHVSQGSGGWISPIQAPKILRWAAWFSVGCLFFLAWSSQLNRNSGPKFREGVAPIRPIPPSQKSNSPAAGSED
jgi:hypothetical protein